MSNSTIRLIALVMLVVGLVGGFYFGRYQQQYLHRIPQSPHDAPNEIAELIYRAEHMDINNPNDDATQYVHNAILTAQTTMSEGEFTDFALRVFNAHSYRYTTRIFYCLQQDMTVLPAFIQNLMSFDGPLNDITWDSDGPTMIYPDTKTSQETEIFLDAFSKREMNQMANNRGISPAMACQSLNDLTTEDIWPLSFPARFPELSETILALGKDH